MERGCGYGRDRHGNNELIRLTQEFVRENLFSPYMGEGLTSIIRLGSELKAGAARRGPATTVASR